MSDKTRSVSLIAAAQVTALALWFSASAVAPELTRLFALSPGRSALLTSAVQAGFVAGSLASALLGLPDRIDPRRLFAASAIAGACLNLGLLVVPMDSWWPVLLRLATGACLAGIYPVGMKLVGSWAERDLGLLIGILVGALCLGSAAPHLFRAVLGGFDWQPTIAAASASALAGAALILAAQPGPRLRQAQRPDLGAALLILRMPGLRLALSGYLGHMWELYAMWAWIGVFMAASFSASGFVGPDAEVTSRLVAFGAIGLGGLVGCVGGGLLADRIGRTRLTILSMAGSGACALASAALFGMPTAGIAVALLWGLFVCADSAQFSAAISELAPPDRVGTMLAAQTSCGFLLTLATIHLVPVLAGAVGWPAAMACLALGPVAGCVAMARLRMLPESLKLAGGLR